MNNNKSRNHPFFSILVGFFDPSLFFFFSGFSTSLTSSTSLTNKRGFLKGTADTLFLITSFSFSLYIFSSSRVFFLSLWTLTFFLLKGSRQKGQLLIAGCLWRQHSQIWCCWMQTIMGFLSERLKSCKQMGHSLSRVGESRSLFEFSIKLFLISSYF